MSLSKPLWLRLRRAVPLRCVSLTTGRFEGLVRDPPVMEECGRVRLASAHCIPGDTLNGRHKPFAATGRRFPCERLTSSTLRLPAWRVTLWRLEVAADFTEGADGERIPQYEICYVNAASRRGARKRPRKPSRPPTPSVWVSLRPMRWRMSSPTSATPSVPCMNSSSRPASSGSCGSWRRTPVSLGENASLLAQSGRR